MDVPEASTSTARVFAQCFSSASTGGPLSRLPSHEIIWTSDDGNEEVVVVGWDDFRKLDPVAAIKRPIEWTAKRLYDQMRYAIFMRSAEHMDMVLDEWHLQYLEQSAMRQDSNASLAMLDFDREDALSLGDDDLWGASFRGFVSDVLKAEGLLNLTAADGTQEDQKNRLRDSTQARICARYHSHVHLQGKSCYKEQADAYSPEQNVHELYHQMLLKNHNGWYTHPSNLPERDDLWTEASAPLVKEAEQAVDLVLQERFDYVAARLAPLSDQVDPKELLMNPVEAHDIPRDCVESYIPIIRESVEDFRHGRQWCDLPIYQFALDQANSLLALLEECAGVRRTIRQEEQE